MRNDNVKSSTEKPELKKKKVTPRKYVNCILMMISVVLIVFIASKIYTRYQEGKLSESVFTRFVGTVQYDDLDSVLNEMSTDAFILISYVKSTDTKNLENALKKSITNNGLASNFYYLDATDLMLDNSFIDSLNTKLKLDGKNKIEKLPAIVYYNDGKYMKTLTSTPDRMLTVDDFNKMLDSYEIIDKD